MTFTTAGTDDATLKVITIVGGSNEPGTELLARSDFSTPASHPSSWNGTRLMKVDFTIPEVDVRAECECGFVIYGDSAVDAFTLWWSHKSVHEQPETPPVDPGEEVETPGGTPGSP